MANNLPMEKKIAAVAALAEGSSIRSIERMTGIHRDTIMRLGVRVGEGCAKLMNWKMQDLSCRHIEVDELWGFIGAKKKNVTDDHLGRHYGDVWTFIALDSETKLIPSYLVGARDGYHAYRFMKDLAERLNGRVQLSTDALRHYRNAVESGFGSEVDYGQIVKTYSVTNLTPEAAGRYSPADVVKTERNVMTGFPNEARITTSHVEKQNHTLRMHCRRLSRLTNAFSKCLPNFKAAVALNFAYYNFVKVHGAIKTTPAKAAGVEFEEWSMAHLLEMSGESRIH